MIFTKPQQTSVDIFGSAMDCRQDEQRFLQLGGEALAGPAATKNTKFRSHWGLARARMCNVYRRYFVYIYIYVYTCILVYIIIVCIYVYIYIYIDFIIGRIYIYIYK